MHHPDDPGALTDDDITRVVHVLRAWARRRGARAGVRGRRRVRTQVGFYDRLPRFCARVSCRALTPSTHVLHLAL